MAEFASKGVSNTALGLGIAGTVGLLNQMGGCNNGNNGLLGGLFGGNKNCEKFITQETFNWAEKYNQSQTENSFLRSENFTRQAATKAFEDSVTYAAGLNDKVNTNLKEIYGIVIQQGQEIAQLKGDIKTMAAANEKDHTILSEEFRGGLKLEAERRECGDKNLYSYVNGTFVPGKLIMPLSSICPPAQPATSSGASSGNIDINVIVEAVATALSRGRD